MARKKKKKKSVVSDGLRPETKNSIAAIFLIGLALVLMLAVIGKAGPAGEFLFTNLGKLFGLGYYLLPLTALAVGILFLFSRHEEALMGRSLGGALVFVLAGLGFIDILFSGRGGYVGQGIGALENPFGFAASIVLTLVVMIISLLVTFDKAISLENMRLPSWRREDKEDPAALREDEAIVVATPKGTVTDSEAEPEEDDYDEDDEVETDDEAETVQVAEFPEQVGAKSRKQKLVSSAAYVAPPMSLLKSIVDRPTSGDLRANANIIKRTLDSFGIPVEMGEINIGPKVTRYTLKPAEGIKLSRIIALGQDLSLALAAHPIRIEAPIPGKSLVGIEVPNKAAAVVRLGSLLSYQDFIDSGPLTVILGRDVTGELVMADLEKMPHLMIAGATGSGKSIFLHSVLVSLLYKNSPETLQLVLIDPKRVELNTYKEIPHLVTPVITDGKKALNAFRWAVSEMERRYELLMHAGARDISSYNKKVDSRNDGMDERLPYLLIVIDELADLMAAHGREIESSIVRLAQMARATGLHLILATQRPSVEVITGLIKANITARVALQVASQIDSRTILDMAGAEKLLGGGDMLFISAEFSKPKRIQAPYLSEEELEKVASFIRKNNKTEEAGELETGNGDAVTNYLDNNGDDVDDDLFTEAVQVVREAQKASASLLQRRLKVGYARAARLLDIMEDKGIVGPGDGAKPREVYVDDEGDEAYG
jgi:DNA segregation ATPase FtsK/SpoIIIE, S-DNA-T family